MTLAAAVCSEPVWAMLPCAFFALLWGVAASHKMLSWRVFAQQLADYRLLPDGLAASAAVLLPLLEAALAASWLYPAGRPLAATMSALLLAAYAGGMAYNLRRGRDTIACGCGGDDGQVIRWALVWRNLALAAVAVAAWPLAPSNAPVRAMGWVDWLSVDAGALALLGIYAALNQILANLPPQRLLR